MRGHLIGGVGRCNGTGGGAARRRFRGLMVTVLAGLLLGVIASAQVTGLYFQEITKDGRIYVFNTPERYKAFTATGEMGTAITLFGRGPNGETVIAENETAIDLFLFKHNLPGYDRPTPKLQAPPAPAAFPQVKVGGTAFLSYQDGKTAGANYSKFVIKRAYINVNAKINSYFSARITPDVTQDSTTGEMKYRLKYAYGMFSTPQLGFLTKPYVSFGMVQTPWLDFEEKIIPYRMQDTFFLERVGLISSADAGVVVGAMFGGEMPDDYQKTVSSAYPGRYGSFAIGVYDGGGYAAAEQNTNKPVEGRLSIRPFPDIIPGLQLSYFGVSGRGNIAAEPKWTLNSGSLSFESRYVHFVGTYVTGTGDLAGKALNTKGVPLDRNGWSGFVEVKPSGDWSIIGRYDNFKPDTTNALKDTKRTIAGIAYHIGKGNDLLFDYDEIKYSDPTKPKDNRRQLTLQLNF